MQKIGQLDFKKYYQRRIFGNPYLSNSEIVDRLLSLSDDLKVAYEYFQTLISYREPSRFNCTPTIIKLEVNPTTTTTTEN